MHRLSQLLLIAERLLRDNDLDFEMYFEDNFKDISALV